MKELTYKSGGRCIYIDDLINIQAIGLEAAGMVRRLGNFVIDGCEVKNNTITPGIVYIDGKILEFPGSRMIAQWPVYLVAAVESQDVIYESGGMKEGVKNYYCTISASAPEAGFIQVSKQGAVQFREACIGRQLLLLSGILSIEDGITRISSGLTVTGDINCEDRMFFKNDFAVCGIETTEDKAFQLRRSYTRDVSAAVTPGGSNISVSKGVTDTISIPFGGGMEYRHNNTPVFTVDALGNVDTRSVAADTGEIGGVGISGVGIYNSFDNETAALEINLVGYEGKKTQFRNTVIGDGKGKTLFSVCGETGITTIQGLRIESDTRGGFILMSRWDGQTPGYTNTIEFQDASDEMVGQIGYNKDNAQTMVIRNLAGEMILEGQNFVNIKSELRVKGISLDDMYVRKSKIYTKYEIDDKLKELQEFDPDDMKLTIKDITYTKAQIEGLCDEAQNAAIQEVGKLSTSIDDKIRLRFDEKEESMTSKVEQAVLSKTYTKTEIDNKIGTGGGTCTLPSNVLTTDNISDYAYSKNETDARISAATGGSGITTEQLNQILNTRLASFYTKDEADAKFTSHSIQPET